MRGARVVRLRERLKRRFKYAPRLLFAFSATT